MAEILISDIHEKMISANDTLSSDPPEARPHRKTQRLRWRRRRQRRCFLQHCQPLLDIATQRSRRRRRSCRARHRGLRSQRSRSTNLGRRRRLRGHWKRTCATSSTATEAADSVNRRGRGGGRRLITVRIRTPITAATRHFPVGSCLGTKEGKSEEEREGGRECFGENRERERVPLTGRVSGERHRAHERSEE